MRFLALFLIGCYKGIRRLWPGRFCRFEPTCSDYSRTAFKTYGFLHALRLTIGRILRCHPWSEGGYDPVPQKTIKVKK